MGLMEAFRWPMAASDGPKPLGIILLAVLILGMVPIGAFSAEVAGVANPGTDLWREVRQRGAADEPGPAPGVDLWLEMRQRKSAALPAGTTQVAGTESGELINSLGDQWRRFRMENLLPYGGYVLGGMFLFVVLFYFVRGRVPIHAGASDKVLFRYSLFERTLHWFLASMFLLQAITGLVMSFGRSILIPVIGHDAFSVLASLSKQGHNLLGFLFLLALTLMIIKFVRRNIYQRGDLSWLLRGGGIIGKKHVPSNFFNMGEKTMFWLLVFAGGTLVVSGFILFLPMFYQGRTFMGLTHAAHGITALVMITVVIGHIYIGSVGMEGALEGMKTGYCDLNWAREHHDWWAQRCEDEGKVLSREQVTASVADTAPRQPPAGQTAGESAS